MMKLSVGLRSYTLTMTSIVNLFKSFKKGELWLEDKKLAELRRKFSDEEYTEELAHHADLDSKFI